MLQKITYEQISKYDKLIYKYTRKYRNYSNYEDLLQEARLAVWSALSSYNKDKGDDIYWVSQYVKTKLYREANKHSVFHIPIKASKNIKPFQVDTDFTDTIHDNNNPEAQLITKELETQIDQLPIINSRQNKSIYNSLVKKIKDQYV